MLRMLTILKSWQMYCWRMYWWLHSSFAGVIGKKKQENKGPKYTNDSKTNKRLKTFIQISNKVQNYFIFMNLNE